MLIKWSCDKFHVFFKGWNPIFNSDSNCSLKNKAVKIWIATYLRYFYNFLYNCGWRKSILIFQWLRFLFSPTIWSIVWGSHKIVTLCWINSYWVRQHDLQKYSFLPLCSNNNNNVINLIYNNSNTGARQNAKLRLGIYIYIYVCVCVCEYIYIYVCVCVWIYIYIGEVHNITISCLRTLQKTCDVFAIWYI